MDAESRETVSRLKKRARRQGGEFERDGDSPTWVWRDCSGNVERGELSLFAQRLAEPRTPSTSARSSARSTRQVTGELETHDAAAIFPLMDRESLGLLRQDIEANGQREPVLLLDGRIVDGRNRYAACRELSRPVTVVDLPASADVLAIVTSANLRRRQLTRSQAACVAVNLEPLFAARAAERQRAGIAAGDEAGRAIDAAARLAGCGSSLAREAKSLKQLSPVLFARVLAGEDGLTVSEATRQVNAVARLESQNADRDSGEVVRIVIEDTPAETHDVVQYTIEHTPAENGQVRPLVAEATDWPNGPVELEDAEKLTLKKYKRALTLAMEESAGEFNTEDLSAELIYEFSRVHKRHAVRLLSLAELHHAQDEDLAAREAIEVNEGN